MKNTFFLITIYLCFVIGLGSCKKSDLINGEFISKDLPIQKRDLHFTPITGDVWDLVRDTSDESNSKVNWALMHFALATKQAVNVDAYNHLIIDYMWSSLLPYGGASIVELCNSDLTFKSYFDSLLRNSIISYMNANPPVYVSNEDLQNPNWSPLSFLTSLLLYDSINYTPYLHFCKKVSAMNKTYDIPVISIGEQIDGYDDEDDIVGWEGGTQVKISEEQANSYNDKVIIVGLTNFPQYTSGTSFVSLEGEFVNFTDNQANDRAPNEIHMTQWQIKKGYRFERSGKSELAGGYHIWSYAWQGTSWQNHAGYEMDWNTIKISKGDINDSKSFTGDEYCFIGPSTGRNLSMINFEQDWYARSFWTNPCFSTIIYEFKSKYASEYYFKNTSCSGNVKSNWFVPNNTYTISNNKSSFTFEWIE